MKKKMYELWHSDYDGNRSWQFTHPENKLKMEFQQDCEDVLREFGTVDIMEIKSWIGCEDLLIIVANNLHTKGYISIDDTFENISFGMGGSSIIERGDDYNEQILKLAGDDISELVYLHNEKIRDTI